jgi:hypothetical protein
VQCQRALLRLGRHPECGFGNHELAHLVTANEIYCIVCLEEQRRQIRVEYWEESELAQARLRLAAA